MDLARIAVPAPRCLAVVEDCAARGVRALLVISAGFAEVGAEGREQQRRLAEQVRGHGMRMIGPNCLGLMNTDPAVRLNASFSPIFPPPGRIAMSSQSGALGLAVLAAAAATRVGVVHLRQRRQQGRCLRQRPAAILGGRRRTPPSSCSTWNRSAIRGGSGGSHRGSAGGSRLSRSRAADRRRGGGQPDRTRPRWRPAKRPSMPYFARPA